MHMGLGRDTILLHFSSSLRYLKEAYLNIVAVKVYETVQ